MSNTTYSIGELLIFKVVDVVYEGVLFSFIFHKKKLCRDYTEVLGSFDIDINKIAYKIAYKNGSIILTEAAWKDLSNRTLTFNHEKLKEDQLRHSLRVHLPKLISYYPGYQLKL